MNEQDVKGITYDFGKIPALAQFHIVRRLAPIIGDLLTTLGPMMKGKKAGDKFELTEEEMLKGLGPIMMSISKLSDEDANYAIFGLLNPVRRKISSAGGYAKINTGENLMFEDIDMAVMIQIAVKSFVANLGGFINALPSGLKEGAVQQAQPVG